MKYIITITLLGIIPFYFKFFFEFFNFNINYSNKFHLIYGAMIVSFLCGMQWQRFIYMKKKFVFLIIPISNFLFTWMHIFSPLFQKYFIIIGLLVCVMIDLKVKDKFLDNIYLQTRIIATISAISSYFLNYQ